MVSAGQRNSGQREQADFLGFESLLADDERAVRDGVRTFVRQRIEPDIADWYEREIFPKELAPELGAMGLLGMHLEGYGCAGRSAVEYGLACMELETGDSGLRTFVSVQGSLVMTAIHRFGSEEQRREWLPGMSKGEVVGCFGLTEPDAGSDPASMKTRARKDGSDWVLNGNKRWIGLGSIADVAVIWAHTEDGVRGFLVPVRTPGFTARDIGPKLSMRASVQCDLSLEDVRLPAGAMLPEAKGLRAPFACLNEARYGIVWGSMGAARSCYEIALQYAGARVQFGRPIAGFQLTQQKLVNMMLEIEKGQMVALRLGRMKDGGGLRPEQISFGKLNNVREALAVAREARTILGGNGILAERPIMRHMNNLESVLTYEGTSEIHMLILGNIITGIPAFR